MNQNEHQAAFMADVKNKIYEAGLFREGERIVLAAEPCVLLEYYTGKTYSYRVVDTVTLKTKRLFSRQHPLTESGYQRAMEKMMGLAGTWDADTDSPPPGQSTPTERSEALLAFIFTDIFPKHGMPLRESQLSLALSMLRALWENKLALCEAEVGTGKTHAYILAVTVHNLFSARKLPTTISTSTIALQKALTEEYIPQISNILMEHRIIDRPLSFVVRKGRSHYACDSRVKGYGSSIAHNGQSRDAKLLILLHNLFTGSCPIDLDALPLTDYVKARICVERCGRNCGLSAVCRYRSFLYKAQNLYHDFQITNHNLVLADVLSQKRGGKGLLPHSGAVIFDEAHKLPDAARQMYGTEFDSMELERLAGSIYRAISGHHPDKKEIIKLCEEMLQQNTLLFEAARNAVGVRYEKDCYAVSFNINCILALNALTEVFRRLSVLFYTLNPDKKEAYGRLVSRMEQEQVKIAVLLDHPQYICWLETMGAAACRICTLPKHLDFLLHEDIWSAATPCILTSGTLSVGGDFSYFKQGSGIAFTEPDRIFEASKASPFDYQENALLYLPQDMPLPGARDGGYLQAVTDRLAELIEATHGHSLILFTSYRMMEQTYTSLCGRISGFPLFMMGRGRLDALSAFRKSGNGILLASDSAGEGIDLAGDILSSLIVVRLPFPIPDPVLEYEKTLYDGFESYLNEIIVPEMLMKLRQWIGRGIRRETDTCVFSILDGRASRRYKADILTALPDMPVTGLITDVGRFIAEKKSGAYFD